MDLRLRGTTLRVVECDGAAKALAKPKGLVTQSLNVVSVVTRLLVVYGKFLPFVSGRPTRTTNPATKKRPSRDTAIGNA